MGDGATREGPLTSRQPGSTRASLTHSLSLSLARDNHGDSDSDVQPDTVVERSPPSASHLISSSSPAPSSPSLFPREAVQPVKPA